MEPSPVHSPSNVRKPQLTPSILQASPRNRVLTYSNGSILRSASNPVPVNLSTLNIPNSRNADDPEGPSAIDPVRPLSKTISEVSEAQKNRGWRHSTQIKVENAERMKILMPKQVSLINLNSLQEASTQQPYMPTKTAPNTILTTVTPLPKVTQ